MSKAVKVTKQAPKPEVSIDDEAFAALQDKAADDLAANLGATLEFAAEDAIAAAFETWADENPDWNRGGLEPYRVRRIAKQAAKEAAKAVFDNVV
jgi:hypothetical protein